MKDAGLWSAVAGAAGAILGVVAKTGWDYVYGWRTGIPMETWKTRASQLEKRLSGFYWPLYIRLQRDDVIWEKVFADLRGQREGAAWAQQLSEDKRRDLAKQIESEVILPNHAEAAGIIRSNIHLANADAEFSSLLAAYIRHVDVYSSMRKAGMWDIDPLQLQEPFPKGLSEAVHVRLLRFQAEYEELLKEKGVLDLRRAIQRA